MDNVSKVMHYINCIKNNTIGAIEIRKIALAENVDYNIAKIMYNDGKRNVDKQTATLIFLKMDKYEISFSIINELNRHGFGIQYDNFDIMDLYRKICKYANKEMINKIGDIHFLKYYYAQKICELIDKNNSLDNAIRIFDNSIQQKMHKSGMSEFAATFSLITNMSDIASKEYEIAFKEKYDEKMSSEGWIVDRLFVSDDYFKKWVHDIFVISQSEEGINKLENIINKAFKNGNQQYISSLTDMIHLNGLILTDFPLVGNKNVSHFHQNFCYIFLNSYALEDESVFYHETTHFLDYTRGLDNSSSTFYSAKKGAVAQCLQKIKSQNRYISRALSLSFFWGKNAKKYVNDEKLNKKWLEEIRKEHPDASDDEISLFLQQKKLYERKKYRVFSTSLQDIYDGLVGGKLYSFGLTPGHGMKYYSKKNRVLAEFLAEIGEIYNYGGLDFLNYELGEELSSQIMQMYFEFLRSNDPSYDDNSDNLENVASFSKPQSR